MFSNINETNLDLTKYLINTFNENNMLIDEIILQNVVFKIKKTLKQNNFLSRNIPFYWYFNGPFSETISWAFGYVRKFLGPVDGRFSIKNRHVDVFKSEIINDIPKIEEITHNLISREDYVYHDFNEDIYKDFAPLNMIHSFKYDIFNPTENNDFSCVGDDYVKFFRQCEREIMPINYFGDYSLIFIKFNRKIGIQ